MSSNDDLHDAQRLQRRAAQFEAFADRACVEDPLYVALCRLIARRESMLAMLDVAGATQRRPNLLLAAIHDRLLEGCAHPLRSYYPSLGGARLPDAALADVLDGFFRSEHQALRSRIAAGATQTNEIGRCAVLWPALAAISAHAGGRGLALLDFGCSAGLNLGVDHYAYAYADGDGDGGLRCGVEPDGLTPLIACRLIGTRDTLPLNQPLRIAQRLGLDRAPANVHDAISMRWLRACIWPHDRKRVRRFDLAVRIAQQQRWPVQRAADCAALIEPWLDGLPEQLCPVLFNSWVMHYMAPQVRERHVASMRALVQRRGLLWLSAESAAVHLGAIDIPPPERGDAQVSDADIAEGTLWQLTTPGAGGAPQVQVIARSHPHGHWMAWYGVQQRAQG